MTEHGRSAAGLRPFGAEPAPQSQAEPLVPNACAIPPEGWFCTREPGHDGPCAAVEDPIVGSGCLTSGGRVPIRKSYADYIWAQAEAEQEERRKAVPDERAAIHQLWNAQERLKELGWKDPVYAPKDGSPLDIIELGSSGIHRGYYQGDWPTGSWWVVDGDVWPSRPALARAASGTAAGTATDSEAGVAEGKGPAPKGDAQ